MRRALGRVLVVLLAIGVSSCQRAEPEIAVSPGVALSLAQQRASLLGDVRYQLHLTIPRTPEEPVLGSMTITFTLSKLPSALQLDFHAHEEQVLALQVNGKETAIDLRAEHIVFPRTRLDEGRNTVDIEFVAGDGALNRNPEFLYSLFVPDRARTVFPVFDQPDIKARWRLSLDIPADWVALSSATQVHSQSEGSRKTVYFGDSDRMSSYLFSFVAGKFEVVERQVNGRRIRLLHREPEQEKVTRNVDELFRLHGNAIAWLEQYTGIPLPFQKFDVVLIPSHPYGGMEHVGAIQYRAESLWLDEAPSDVELLSRASLIAHETAHMWFGNLVTMRWFDDVWTKEVFANFMAAKIVNPEFPGIDHDLKFLARHYPRAYAIDRTAGANAIRQSLPNLNQAGQLYGGIIYNKAPIMMRQLELKLGESAFQTGVQTYLSRFSHDNATWPELLQVLDPEGALQLSQWSDVWVNSAGRPSFALKKSGSELALLQRDLGGKGRLWPQQFAALLPDKDSPKRFRVQIRDPVQALATLQASDRLLLNADGFGYGVFPVSSDLLSHWHTLSNVNRGSLLIQLYEQMLAQATPAPALYLEALLDIVGSERNQVLLGLALDQLRTVYWQLISESYRRTIALRVEEALWSRLMAAEESSLRRSLFLMLADIAISDSFVQRVENVWRADLRLENLPLSERDLSAMAMDLANKRPARAAELMQTQLKRVANPDERRRLQFLVPSLSEDEFVRDAFFASLSNAENRRTESWVLAALANLHHPARVSSAEKYVLPALELLEEIQATGDIFFPAGWLQATLHNHSSDAVIQTVESFLQARPNYNPQLKRKMLQALDPALRANRLRQLTQP